MFTFTVTKNKLPMLLLSNANQDAWVLHGQLVMYVSKHTHQNAYILIVNVAIYK